MRVLPNGSAVENSPANAGDAVSTPGPGRPLEEGKDNHSSILGGKNPMNSGAWWATVHRWQRVRHNLVAEKQQQIFMKKECNCLIVLWLSMR